MTHLITRLFADFDLDQTWVLDVELTPAYVKHLIGLMDKAAELKQQIPDFCGFTVMDWSPDYYEDPDLEEALGQDNAEEVYDGPIFINKPKWKYGDENADYSRLFVASDHVFWEASPKHGRWAFESDSIRRADLEDWLGMNAAA